LQGGEEGWGRVLSEGKLGEGFRAWLEDGKKKGRSSERNVNLKERRIGHWE